MNVLVFGTFDILHPGHRFVIDEARARGTAHVVVGRDANVARIKGVAPHHAEGQRMKAIQDAFPDVIVELGDEHDFLDPVRRIKPDLILLGYDQQFPPGVQDADLACVVERLPAFEPDKWKSSILKEKLQR